MNDRKEEAPNFFKVSAVRAESATSFYLVNNQILIKQFPIELK